MLINTNSKGYNFVRGLTGFVAGLGAGTLTGSAIKQLGYVPSKKYQVVTVAVATVAVGFIVSSAVNELTKNEIDDVAHAVNSTGDLFKSRVKVSVQDN